jgi:hypothetical protein
MNYSKTLTLGLCITFFGTSLLSAQDQLPEETANKEIKVQKHTILERFETDFMVSADERKEMKTAHIAMTQKRYSILDTLDISERKRRKLMSDLYESPFSDRLNRTMADLEFEDEEIED